MENANHLHYVTAHPVGNDVRRSRDHQLPGAGYPAGPAQSWEMFKIFDRFYDCGHGPGGCIGVVLGYVFGHGDQVRVRRSQPLNAHVGINA